MQGGSRHTEPPEGGAELLFDAIVLAGGRRLRFGGADKALLEVGGRSMLDRVLDACADAGHVVVVGQTRPTSRAVSWAFEEPPGGGPLAGLAAGLAALPQGNKTAIVVAADLPYLTPK